MTSMNKRYLAVFPMALFLFALFLVAGEQDYSTGVISVEEFQSNMDKFESDTQHIEDSVIGSSTREIRTVYSDASGDAEKAISILEEQFEVGTDNAMADAP